MEKEKEYENYKKCKSCENFIECSKKMDPYELQPCFSFRKKHYEDYSEKKEYYEERKNKKNYS